jgi:hypothetical protein
MNRGELERLEARRQAQMQDAATLAEQRGL